jgi:hypothetical protein
VCNQRENRSKQGNPKKPLSLENTGKARDFSLAFLVRLTGFENDRKKRQSIDITVV